MKHWRITKYDPVYRDGSGAYRREDWTAYDDIGRTFNGVVLSEANYLQIEDLYVAAAVRFVREAQLPHLVAVDVELGESDLTLVEGMTVGTTDLPAVIRDNLRTLYWCKLEMFPRFYLHFGYDYYMYIGSQVDLPKSVSNTVDSGLFVEACVSPYYTWEELTWEEMGG